ncbi:class II aldolase/adducin family protein [Streptomyces paludis]|uniref:Aldolase n=1 Tax=Streptomyces paludis TaxID=2282738 RepID=A0A345HZN5_9ACTN|nr:class II aldolase/adducin family protein [Streptomyces paludis]AXG82159.1 aldolase [Streptomyces paludis]
MSDARAELVAAGAALSAAGLSPGTSGNLSVRVGGRIYMTPTGARLEALDPEALAVLDADAPLDAGHTAGPAPSKEFPLHRAFYRRDPATRAVVHLHSAHAAACSCLPPWSRRSALAPLTPYFVMRVGQTPLIPYAAPGDPEQARQLELLDFPFHAALLQNHGPITAGDTLARAVDAAVELEEVSRLTLLLKDTGPRVLTTEEAGALARRYGTVWEPVAGR